MYKQGKITPLISNFYLQESGNNKSVIHVPKKNILIATVATITLILEIEKCLLQKCSDFDSHETLVPIGSCH